MRREDSTRNIMIGLAVAIVIVLIIIFLIRRRTTSPLIKVNSPLPTPVTSFENNLQSDFGITVPTNATKADLKDITGKNQVGLISLTKENNQNMYTVIANLEDAPSGYFYQAWLVKDNYAISLGKLNIAKAGWISNYTSPSDISDHKTVWITLEKTNDQTPETHVLEGSF